MAFAQGKLGKMTIIFYPFAQLPGVGGIPFYPMYNPSTLEVGHTVTHECKPLPKLSDLSPKFVRTNPRSLTTELFFDGTGASPSNISGLESVLPGISSGLNDVELQVQTFLKLGYQIGGALHRPSYMMVMWGTFFMTGVLTSASVTYSMFDAAGKPLRARLKVSIKEYVDINLKLKEIKLQSSDVSKSITVVAGDTLPQLCYKEYGDSTLYTKIAEVNNLDNYRNLTPGMQLLFPPLTSNIQ